MRAYLQMSWVTFPARSFEEKVPGTLHTHARAHTHTPAPALTLDMRIYLMSTSVEGYHIQINPQPHTRFMS